MPGQGKKRTKKYKQHSNKRAKIWSTLDIGMSGFLLTCNNREKETVREAYNLLEQYGNKMYPEWQVCG